MELSGKERNENAIEAGLQLIPGVGGALATLYFGRKQEVRFKRLEDFYSQLSDELGVIQDKFPPVEKHDEALLVSIIEKINEKIERESVKNKIDYFKIYFKNVLLSPVTKNNFDKRTVFLSIISELTLFECDILLRINSLKEDETISALDISRESKEGEYYIGSAMHQLRNFGFIRKYNKGVIYRGETDPALLDRFKVSDFGKEFIYFCMQQD